MKQQRIRKTLILGLMSGTSLDGLDIALVSFWEQNKRFHYAFEAGKTYTYPTFLKDKLILAPSMAALNLARLNAEYGEWMGKKVKHFVSKHQVIPRAVASHGYTVFHEPFNNFTLQIGHGANLSVACGLPVICDFRSLDVSLGGQGAPLVPIGDDLLFEQIDFCLNLGGISNISYKYKSSRIAYDISPCNLALNYLSEKKGLSYDSEGQLAKSGNINRDLFEELNQLDFYHTKAPKSLGREWVEAKFIPILDKYNIDIEDKLNTTCLHIAHQIERILKVAHPVNRSSSLLISGGGAKNSFLKSCIKKIDLPVRLISPNDDIINYKEAIIFAFLGYLKIKNKNNTLASVTGATRDSCGGVIYGKLSF